MTDTERQRMSELCTAIVSEYDPQKMMRLVRELNVLLEAKQQRLERNEAGQARNLPAVYPSSEVED